MALSEDVAQDLSHHRGSYISMNGLEHLSSGAAGALADCKGDLGLNGLRELSNDAAAQLAGHKGMIYLEGIEAISDFAKEALGDRATFDEHLS